MIKNPCYDEELRRDCPDRCVGCAVNCKKWTKYVQMRNDMYERKLVEYAADSIIHDARRERECQFQTGYVRTRQNKVRRR